MFYWLPVEELIQKNQQGYYNALSTADARADSSGFVEFMLELFVDALKQAGSTNDPLVEVNTLDVVDESKPALGILAGVGRSWPMYSRICPNSTVRF